jgi:hypothetical protein
MSTATLPAEVLERTVPRTAMKRVARGELRALFNETATDPWEARA